ncbi:MAG: MFS transporter, partial [Chloroflexi bacterium]|nr:MFS transporter [Chloroflexota bacterium]
MLQKMRSTYDEFPNTFWTLTGANFVDQIGSFMLFPFFALYITDKFNVGMTQVGILFTVFSIGSVFGGILGGAMTDKYGRKTMILFGLVVSGVGSISMGLVNDLNLFYMLAVVLGMIGSAGGPARQAMVADILPAKKQAEGYGIMRVSANLAATIGPALGGFLASKSFMFLFIGDAVSSVITGIIVYFVIPETKPKKAADEPEETIIQTMGGYKVVFGDWVFMAYLTVSALMVLVYMQMNSTLSVFLRDSHGLPAEGFGWILSMNAAMVVLFQFWVTRKISGRPPMLLMAIGTFLYAIGFSMYGFVSATIMFFVAMAIITVGEMITAPIGQSLAAQFAPEDKRGRYMAVFGFSWLMPNMFGVLGAGLVMDYFNPNWVWYLSGIISLVVVIGFLALGKPAAKRLEPVE